MATTKDTFLDKYLTPLAVLVGALIIGGALFFGHGSAAPATQATGTATAAVNVKDVKTTNEPMIGSPSAPVELAVWFDYQCPFCKQFDTTVLPQLYTNYVKTGKLKIVFKDFQFLGNDSTTAALFARAVWSVYPDQFYTWYQAVFNAQDQEGDQGFGDLPTIETLTKSLPGFDVAKIEANMNANKTKYQTAITADRSEGATFGVNGTPSAVLGTQLLEGTPLYDYPTISGLIDKQPGA